MSAAEASPVPPTRTPKMAPYLTVRDAAGLVRFLQEGIGGRLGYRAQDGDGRVMHAEMLVADSVVMLADVPPDRTPFPAMIHLYVPDVDAAYARAIRAGAKSVRPPTDAPEGDRRGGVADAWGNEWWFTQAPREA